jgi:thioredoxin 1
MEIKSQKEFEAEVLKSKIPVIVDFWAEWCAPCRAYSPIIETVSKGFKEKLKLVKVNVDDNEELSTRYNISSIPTTFLIENGKIKTSLVGAVNKESLKKWIKENI